MLNYYYYHFYSIYETGQKLCHIKMDYLNLQKKRKKKKKINESW